MSVAAFCLADRKEDPMHMYACGLFRRFAKQQKQNDSDGQGQPFLFLGR
jgi:hypothetical protein